MISTLRVVAVGSLLGLGLWVQPAAGAAPPLRVLPVGDSITYGSSVNGGYRLPLYQLLTNAGYTVDMVGTQTGNSTGMADPDHEGHGGWRIDQIDSIILSVFDAIEDPDVILLLIGTNDYGQNYDQDNATNRLEALIAKMAIARPYAKIIVANLLERAEPNNTEIQTTFNPFVQSICERQRGLGREVYFNDLRSAVPVADMPDALHPGATGYAKMATNWFRNITNHFSPEGSTNAPALARAAADGLSNVVVTFSKPVADAAASIANFALDSGASVLSASLSADKRKVILTTTLLASNALYTVTVNGVKDRTAAQAVIAANSTTAFRTYGPAVRGALNNVPEAANYTLVYALDIPNNPNFTGGVNYNINLKSNVTGFSRVAYYLELQTSNGPLNYVWVSMDAFTTNVNHIGVPTIPSGAFFQQAVTNLNVWSSASNIVVGTNLSGWLEFWPSNYTTTNIAGVPNASGTVYDWGDQMTTGTYGSMQVHNPAASQVLFAFNRWNAGAACDLGIGNNTGSANPDWTFMNNGNNYLVKTLQVYVLLNDNSAPPVLAGAACPNNNSVVLTFSKPIAEDSTNVAFYALDGGLSVLSATVEPISKMSVTLTTTPQTPAAFYTVTVNGVRDRTTNQMPVAPNSTANFMSPAVRGVFGNVPEASEYILVYSLNITNNANYSSGLAYDTDNRASVSGFTRVAYYLELQPSGGPINFVWVSMDPFTNHVNAIGVPVASVGAWFQQPVTNLTVHSSVPSVLRGTNMAGGNIEFWPWNYGAANAANVPNASGLTYDWGDNMSTNSGNHGSMQVHNSGASQVLFAFNSWGGASSMASLGIGNNTGNTNADYTFMANAGTYAVKTLQVFVLPETNSPPALLNATAQPGYGGIVLHFSKPLQDDATNAAHYAVSGGVTILNATLDPVTKSRVTLTTSAQQPGTWYAVTVNGLRDRTAGHLEIAPGSAAAFLTASAPGGGLYQNVPEAAAWTLAYALDIPVSGNFNSTGVPYAVDNGFGVTNFTRVAYYLELATNGGPTNWIWVAMDPFSPDARRLGVPTRLGNDVFQQPVANLTVYSSVPGIEAGTNLAGGYIEFWPWNYTQANALNVPNASGAVFDWGDTVSTGTGNYGSMQIHNTAARQVLLAMNNFGGNGGDICLGIGNNTSTADPDWTHVRNAATYVHKKLMVFVLPAPDHTAPALVSAEASLDFNSIIVTFSEPVADATVVANNFILTGPASILGLSLSNNLRQVVLNTTPLDLQNAHTVTVSGVRDRSPGAHLIAPGSTVPVTGPTPFMAPPQLVANVPEAANYLVACQLDIPSTAPNWNTNGTVYNTDNRAWLPQFERIAYYLELATNTAATNWVYVSMDAFTADPRKVGVPDMVSGAFFQQPVTNLNVYSSSPEIATGTGITTGNMEFWPFDYGVSNYLSVPNANSTYHDFGDVTNVTTFSASGYGSMQIHNHGAYGTGQVLFAFNKWGGGQSGNVCLGMGNRPGSNTVDWTFADNAGAYMHKKLWVLVQPAPDVSGPRILKVTPSSFRTNVVVTFDELLADYAADPINFELSGGALVYGAQLRPNLREIVLTTDPLTPDATYTLTVNGVCDRSYWANAIADNSTAIFTAAPDAPVYGRVAESANYQLVHHLALPSVAPNYNIKGITYNADLRGAVLQPFIRTAYYLELATNVGGPTNWIYVSSEAITTNINRVGVPVVGTGAGFQQRLTNMNVYSSDAGIIAGAGITTGNIEFWGRNYTAASNAVNVPTGSNSAFDWNDTHSSGGYGSMQIHNWSANSTGQVLFAFNRWGGAQVNNPGVGIGTRPASANMDWTHADNAATYAVKNLYVLVQPANLPPPANLVLPPGIVLHPFPQLVQREANVSLAAMASSSLPVTYQWLFNEIPLPGATNSWLEIPAVQKTFEGDYRLVAVNSAGSATSLVATLTVNQPPLLANKSTNTLQNVPLLITAADLLAGGADPDGDLLSLQSVSPLSTNGGSLLLTNGGVLYQPPPGYAGADRFSYVVSDGRGGQVVAQMVVQITAAEGFNQVRLGLVAGGFRLQFVGVPGTSYQVQRSSNLVHWLILTNVTAAPNGSLVFDDLTPLPNRGFYRTAAE